MASKRNGTLYIGVTSDLVKRVYEHKTGATHGFTEKYRVHNLVYYEMHGTIIDAITREKRLKLWKRQWKVRLIEEVNPDWIDLSQDILGLSGSLPPQG
jgi:putative endonuclease